MKKILAGLVIIIAIIVFFGLRETKFNVVTLSEYNHVNNRTDKTYIDTIIKVGLDELKLKNVFILVSTQTEEQRNSFSKDLELKAHITEINGFYFLYLGDISRNEAIRVVAHELIHLKQYKIGKLKVEGKSVFWLGKLFDMSVEYSQRPWEIEAYEQENELKNKIEDIL